MVGVDKTTELWSTLQKSTFMIQETNGCMWFVPGSHLHPLKKHRPTKEGKHVLMTEECSNVSNLLRNKTGFSTFAGSDGDDDRGTS